MELKLLTLDGRQARLSGRLEILSKNDRVRRAMRVTVILWSIAAFTILLPGLHFVLPPAILVAGAYFGFKVWRQTEVVRDVEGPCPSCGKPLEFPLLVKQDKLKDLCPNCRHSFRIQFW